MQDNGRGLMCETFKYRKLAFGALIAALGVTRIAVAQSSWVGAPDLLPSAPTNTAVDGKAVAVDPLLSGMLAGASVRSFSTPFTSAVQGPTFSPPSLSGDIVGFAVENIGNGSSAQQYRTFGQVFAQGAVHIGDSLGVRTAGGSDGGSVQLDALAFWPDGSVRFGAITMAVPSLEAGVTQAYELRKSQGTGQSAPLAWTSLPFSLSVSLSFVSPAGLTRNVDLHAALMQSSTSAPDVWLTGPIAIQSRVDVPVNQTLHLTADITGYKDGSIVADVQFNNDLTQVSNSPPNGALPPLVYQATVTLNGKSYTYHIPAQYQFQDWHTVISTYGVDTLNIEHDSAYLERTGALLPFDLNGGVSATTLNGMVGLIASPGFGTPLAASGVDPDMPQVGGRPDIGYTTVANATWLVTQTRTSEAVAIMQADAGGSVPWNMRLANGHWLTPGDYSTIWTDDRSGAWGLVGLANSAPIGIGQLSGWVPDASHMPDLPYIPYLMTASRWYLDRLNAQAAFGLNAAWPTIRNIAGYTDILTNTQGDSQQVRGAAWSMREIIEAAWIGKSGSWEQTYFSQVEADNWNWMQSQEKVLNTSGQLAGFWYPMLNTYFDCNPSSPGCSPGSSNPPEWLADAPWQQDFLTGVIIMGAEMGNAQAMQIAEWQRNWVVGRFVGPGMNPHDGCAYTLTLGNYPQTAASAPAYFSTWTQLEGAMAASGTSNGSGWAHSNGYYCQLARSVLGGLLTLNPNDVQVKSALDWLNGSGAPFLDAQSLELTPNFDVIPLQ